MSRFISRRWGSLFGWIASIVMAKKTTGILNPLGEVGCAMTKGCFKIDASHGTSCIRTLPRRNRLGKTAWMNLRSTAVHPEVVGVAGSAGFSPLHRSRKTGMDTLATAVVFASRSGVNAALRYRQLGDAPVRQLA
jgi:hypothetical protein